MIKLLTKIVLGMFALIVVLIAGYLLTVHMYHPVPDMDLTPNNRDPNWVSGDVFHILPTVNHNRFLIKTSYTRALKAPPRLKIGNRSVKGRQTDTKGYFWSFDIPNLRPETSYTLLI